MRHSPYLRRFASTSIGWTEASSQAPRSMKLWGCRRCSRGGGAASAMSRGSPMSRHAPPRVGPRLPDRLIIVWRAASSMQVTPSLLPPRTHHTPSVVGRGAYQEGARPTRAAHLLVHQPLSPCQPPLASTAHRDRRVPRRLHWSVKSPHRQRHVPQCWESLRLVGLATRPGPPQSPRSSSTRPWSSRLWPTSTSRRPSIISPPSHPLAFQASR
mmetsp:Transcript_63583/g.125751  ORF Transcript_63583/g.125751 Transcript_63583/m.125751 type:complete len:213 (+) Transcript_63583:514-1152(+)